MGSLFANYIYNKMELISSETLIVQTDYYNMELSLLYICLYLV